MDAPADLPPAGPAVASRAAPGQTGSGETGADAAQNGQTPNGQTETSQANVKATRDDWIRVALDTLVSEGVDQVKILTLSKKIDVSRSSFYWYFRSRQQLLDALLEIWRDTNTQAILERADAPAATLTQAVLNVFECWVDENVFDPRLDFAVREWARRSGSVRHVVDKADDARVSALSRMYSRFGFDETDAFVRARVLYFMQIGYYALDLSEPMETRLVYVASYLRSFTGQEPSPSEIENFAAMALRAVGRSRAAPPAAAKP